MTVQQIIVFRSIILYAVAPVVGYLLGSVPFALIIGKTQGVDIRTVGSKNIGATNLGRTLGPKFFWFAFLFDVGKGFFPVLLVSLLARGGGIFLLELGPDHQPLHGDGLHFVASVLQLTFASWAPLLTAIACVLGHTFPIYLKFKGGKGVATSFGVVLGFWPLFTLAGLGAGLVFLITVLIYRYISLASIVGSVALVALVALLGTQSSWFTYTPWNQLWPLLAVAALFASLIIFRHRANISRLLKGTEPKINSSKPRPPAA